LIYLLRGVARRQRRAILAVVAAASLLSNLALLLGATALVASRSPLVFEEQPVLAAMDWLGGHAPRQSLVLGAFHTGNVLPGRALVRTFVGHGPLSIDADFKETQVATFFDAATPDGQRRALLTGYDVDYLFYGPTERALGDFSPGAAAYLRPVYDNGPVQIYQVLPGDAR
jgi:hypothetical protein